ncbi:hypothetical protein [Chryseobacterium sp.]|uniref:hypothetical protein n=1 Tax=Chryseobacterium sp. TaxID=1871047 RepID=UPI00289CD66F|nr:hypothetical protein [Chryseobacterium sp.]
MIKKPANKFFVVFIFLILIKITAQTTGNRTVNINLPTVALVDVEPKGTLTFQFGAPTEAGEKITNPAPNTTKWINYTSAITSNGVSRKITASVNQTIPGINIRIQADAASGAGSGTLGTPMSQVTLTTNAKTIINGIGGAYTGIGPSNGHKLTITLNTSSYATLQATTNTPVVITYTITE